VGGEQRKWRANEKGPAAVAVDQTALPWKLEINPCRLFSIRWSLGPANHLLFPEPPPPISFFGGVESFLGWGFLFRRTLLLFYLGFAHRSHHSDRSLFLSPPKTTIPWEDRHLSLSLSLSACAIYNTSIATLGLWMLYTSTYSSFLFCISRCTENTPKLIITEVDNSTAALKPAILMLLQCRRRLLKFMICRFPCEWILFGLE
jgi:hypothetical protein